MSSRPTPQLEIPTPKRLIDALHKRVPGRFATAEKLLEQGANINGLSENRERGRYMASGPVRPLDSVTAVYDAAKRGDYKAVAFLIEGGADVYKRIRTCMSPSPIVVTRPHNEVETLRGLDAMRTSKEPRIVGLTERLYGFETREEHVRRRDAFDNVRAYYPRRNVNGISQLHKPSIPRVKSVLNSRRRPNPQQRYNLRTRK